MSKAGGDEWFQMRGRYLPDQGRVPTNVKEYPLQYQNTKRLGDWSFGSLVGLSATIPHFDSRLLRPL